MRANVLVRRASTWGLAGAVGLALGACRGGKTAGASTAIAAARPVGTPV